MFGHFTTLCMKGLTINLSWCSRSQFLVGNVCVQTLMGTDQPRITNSPVTFIQQLKAYFSTYATLQLFEKFCIQNFESEWSLHSPFVLNFRIELFLANRISCCCLFLFCFFLMSQSVNLNSFYIRSIWEKLRKFQIFWLKLVC